MAYVNFDAHNDAQFNRGVHHDVQLPLFFMVRMRGRQSKHIQNHNGRIN